MSKKNERLHIFVICMIITLLSLCLSLRHIEPIYAAEIGEEQEEPTEEEDSEQEEEEDPEDGEEEDPEDGESIADSVREEAEQIVDEEDESATKETQTLTSSEYLYDDSADGLDGEIVDATSLGATEANNCQLSIGVSMPEGFDANCYVQFQNVDTGVIYNFPLYFTNHFVERGNIPDGRYRLFDSGAYDDIYGMVAFNPVDDFNLSYGEAKSITLSLANEQEIIDLISERTLEEESKVKKEYSFSHSDYEATHTGTGTGNISATGLASADYRLVVKITKGGIPGDMSIAYSIDDGETYSEPVDIALDSKWSFDNVSFLFEVPSITNENGTVTNGSFAEGDTYRFVFWDPNEVLEYSNGDSPCSMDIKDDNPDKNPYRTMQEIELSSVEVRFVKGGSPGEAVYVYRTDSTDWSEQAVLPEDAIIHLPDTTLYLEFSSNSSELKFTGDETFSVSFPKESGINPLYVLIIFLVVVLGGGYFAVYYFFKSQMVSQGVYSIHEYTPVRRNAAVEKATKDKKKRGK